MFVAIFILAGALALAFLNGANDVSKGIATLAGSGTARTHRAVAWGAFWTVAGGLAAAFVGQGLLKAFSGNGLVSVSPANSVFVGAVAGATLLWLALATRTGLPVSTTHALTGALVGAGLVESGAGGIQWTLLWEKFVLPLAASPALSLALMFALIPIFNGLCGPLHRYCICLNRESLALARQPAALTVAQATDWVAGRTADCDCAPATLVRLNALDALHWLSAGATSFARGLNDAPKILALGLVANAGLGLPTSVGFALVAATMGLGSVVAGFRVTETLARKITPMSAGEGFAANLVTSLVVIGASTLALPVSTTHVSSGAIIGVGLKRDARGVHWTTVRDMLLAWVITLPATAGFAAAAIWLWRWIT